MNDPDVSILLRALGRIEGKLDAVARNQTEVKERARELLARVDHLEKEHSVWKGWAAGIAAVVSAILVFISEVWQR